MIKRLLLVLFLSGCAVHGTAATAPSTSFSNDHGAATVKHIVVIMMENRSFDNYFGKFPGANGIPANPNCNPDPINNTCVLPYHDKALQNYGGPHSQPDMLHDLDGGKFDGFIISAEKPPGPGPNPDEVMGYHTKAEIPYYWSLASTYTLADNYFAASASWSTMAHLFLVSGWSAQCATDNDPNSCTSSNTVSPVTDFYAWTDITWLLHAHGVSWGYYVYPKGLMIVNDQGDGEGPADTGASGWNPLPGFDDVRIDGELGNVQAGSNFVAAASAGTLPAVSWVVPSFKDSDHPSNSLAKGQAWVKQQIDAVESGPEASSTLILLTWDEWGGFYDHVVPPTIDGLGYGFRTPLILVGPMVKKAHIDHQMLSSDAYLKLIEDLFLGSERIDGNDGRPDPRPDIRENTPGLGDLRNDLK